MKRKKSLLIVSMILIMTLMAFTGCGTQAEEPAELSAPVNIACMNGPTGMGMVDLMGNENYNIEVFQAPTDAVPKIISGEIDVACVPSNLAAVLYNKTEGQIVSVSPMVMGVLHILGNGVEAANLSDLKGQTIVSAGQGGTPEYALQEVLQNAGLEMGKDVKVEWLASHADVNAKLLSDEGTIAMVPEPFVSAALAQGAGKVTDLFDMNTLWSEATGQDFPMGVLIARRDFVENRGSDLSILLNDLAASIEDVNSASDEVAQKIVDAGFLGNADIAKAAIPNCNLTLYTGEELAKGAEIMKTFNETMFALTPQAVGGALPGEDLYYTGE
ncbi:MAG: ABC transporter substrate-binding protein [Firmicutes bacterium]|nr:ABC transporter substrate-binding protein [Bacillota bacterium]